MTQKYIEASWKSYRSMVVPKEAPDVQIIEIRQAFYAGASILFESIMRGLDAGSEPTDDDMQRMKDIQVEIDAYGQQLDRDFFKLTTH